MKRAAYFPLLVGAMILCGCDGKSSRQAGAHRELRSVFQGEAEAVLAGVQRLSHALYTNDVKTILALTHPRVIERMGGTAQARVVLQDALARIQASGVKVESCTFPEKPTFVQSSDHQFAVVPMKLILSAKGKRRESLHCQVGVRAPGATNWTYVEGSQVRIFFADFPSDVPLPEAKGKAL